MLELGQAGGGRDVEKPGNSQGDVGDNDSRMEQGSRGGNSREDGGDKVADLITAHYIHRAKYA